MQKALSELATLPEAELIRLFEPEPRVGRQPLLVTRNGEPLFVAQSLDDFESMVRRLRHLESEKKAERSSRQGKLILLSR